MKNKVFAVVLVVMAVFLALIAFHSLRWRIFHDSPLFLYMAYLIDHWHYAPYTDFFDVNLPGIYLIYLCVGRIFGYGDFGFRCADLLYLIAISITTVLWMKRLGWKVAIFSAFAFALSYLSSGQVMSMQREYLIILPISLAILVSSSPRKISYSLRGCIVGSLFGLAAVIKPHSALGLPCVVAFQVIEAGHRENWKSYLVPRSYWILTFSLLGFAIPILIMFLSLSATGSLPSFFDMAIQYWPLYVSLAGNHQTITGVLRIVYLFKGYFLLGGCGLLLAPAALGVYISLFNSTLQQSEKRLILLLVGLAFAYSLYPVLGGKFWPYHWLLFKYFCILLSCLCLVGQALEKIRFQRLFPVIVLLIALLPFVQPPLELISTLTGRPVEPPRSRTRMARVDEIAYYLKKRMGPNDTVQALDWTGGALHAMLIAKARTATPFLYDVMFYHHISTAYVQELRKTFLRRLDAAKPRFIIQVISYKPWPVGWDTTKEFPELKALLKADYKVSFKGLGYKIYERRPRINLSTSSLDLNN